MKCPECEGLGFIDAGGGLRIACMDCRGTGYRGGKARVHAVKTPKEPESPIGRLSPRQFLLLLCLWIAAYHVAADARAMIAGKPLFPAPVFFYLLFWIAVGAATKLFAIHTEKRTRRQGLLFIFFALVIKLLAPYFFEAQDMREFREIVNPPAEEAPADPAPAPRGRGGGGSGAK